MHSVHVSSQLLVSVLFIAVPTNTENVKFSYTCHNRSAVKYINISIKSTLAQIMTENHNLKALI